MPNVYDIAYFLGVTASAPVWMARGNARRKVLKALNERMGRMPQRNWQGPCVMIHAVSLGEVNATRALVNTLQQFRPNLNFAISTTTETGWERAKELYGNRPNVALVRYPLDFTAAVNRALDAVRPDVVALMELEIWPNFIRQCERRGVRVVLVNGRITEPAYRRYRMIRPVVARMLRRLSGLCVQTQAYAERFIGLGAPPGRVLVTGSMKFDNAQITDRIAGARDMAVDLGLRPGIDRIWVCGSTGPGEEEIILRTYREMLLTHPRTRLVIVPRHPERFDEVAELIEQYRFKCVRRSNRSQIMIYNEAIPAVVLGDTMGELRKFYSVADVVFVGRSLVDLGPRQHGSDMIEPAALSKPVVVGPYTTNFAEPVAKLKAADAIMVVENETELREAVGVLLSTPAEARAMGGRAASIVRLEQGATLRHAEVIHGLLSAIEQERLAEQQEQGQPPVQQQPPPAMTPPPPTPPSSPGPRSSSDSLPPVSDILPQ